MNPSEGQRVLRGGCIGSHRGWCSIGGGGGGGGEQQMKEEREGEKGKGGKHPRLFKTNQFSVSSNNDQARPLAFESPLLKKTKKTKKKKKKKKMNFTNT